MQLSRLVAD